MVKRRLSEVDEGTQDGTPGYKISKRQNAEPSPINPTANPVHPQVSALPMPPQTYGDLPPLPAIADPKLARNVFTHSSTTSTPRGMAAEDTTYERLEFLGDAYIELISSQLIFSRFPTLRAGRMAQVRETMVNNENLAVMARAYGFADRIAFAGPPHKQWTKILADVFEAYVAALVLSKPDTGFDEAKTWLTALWAGKLGAAAREESAAPQSTDAKTELAKRVCGKGAKLEYREERPMQINRSIGRQSYCIGVYLTGWGFTNKRLGTGTGQNKVLAGNAAVLNALDQSRDVIEEAQQRKLEHDAKRREEAALKEDSTKLPV